jgi:hypothetical protein
MKDKSKSEINSFTSPEMIDIEGSTDGNLSTEIGHLSKLKSFALKNTLVKGSIPSELGRLSNLGRYEKCIKQSS